MGFDWLPPDQYYKKHFICLDCRKGFKRANDAEIININQSASCPQCSKGMIQVDYNFEVPAKSKDKQWRELERRYLKPDK